MRVPVALAPCGGAPAKAEVALPCGTVFTATIGAASTGPCRIEPTSGLGTWASCL